MDVEQKSVAIEKSQSFQITALSPTENNLEPELKSSEIIILAQQENNNEFLNLGLISNPPVSQKVEEQKNVENPILSEHIGTVTKIDLGGISLAPVNSVARDLNISAPASLPLESIVVDNILPVAPTFSSIDLPPIIIDALPAIKAIDNQYNLNKIGHKVIHEIDNQIDFDMVPAGTVLDNNNWLADSSHIQVTNLGSGPDLATLIDSNNLQNGVQNLQTPWHRGNIQNIVSGNILIIADNDIDDSLNGLIDWPAPEGSKS